MRNVYLLVLCILLAFNGCAASLNLPTNSTTTAPTESTSVPNETTPAPYYTTFNSPYLDETDETLLLLIQETDRILDSGESISFPKTDYLDYIFQAYPSVSGEIQDTGEGYTVCFSGSDDSRVVVRFFVLAGLLSEQKGDCFTFVNFDTPNFSHRYLSYYENYRKAGYDSVEAYLAEHNNTGTHKIDLVFFHVTKTVTYEYHDMIMYIDLADLPDSLPKHSTLSSNSHYDVIRRHESFYIDFPDEPIGEAAPIQRSSYEELKNDILTGNFTEAELQSIKGFPKNEHGDIRLFDIGRDLIPIMPEGLEVESVTWSGSELVFNLSGNGITGYMSYELGVDETLNDYHNFVYEGNPDYFCKKTFTYQKGYILECYQRSVSETVPIYVQFWNTGLGEAYGYLTGFTEAPTLEWLQSIGLEHIINEK